MSMFAPTGPIDPELKDLLDKAQARYEAMTPDEQAEMWREQRKSWVRGELTFAYPNMTAEEADRRAREAEAHVTLSPKVRPTV